MICMYYMTLSFMGQNIYPGSGLQVVVGTFLILIGVGFNAKLYAEFANELIMMD